MLSEPKLQEIVKNAAGKELSGFQLGRVLTQPMLDSEGNEALRIVLVLTPEDVNSISGEEALKLLVDIHNGLMREGDERFPIVEYATEADLSEVTEQSDDPDDEVPI